MAGKMAIYHFVLFILPPTAKWPLPKKKKKKKKIDHHYTLYICNLYLYEYVEDTDTDFNSTGERGHLLMVSESRNIVESGIKHHNPPRTWWFESLPLNLAKMEFNYLDIKLSISDPLNKTQLYSWYKEYSCQNNNSISHMGAEKKIFESQLIVPVTTNYW